MKHVSVVDLKNHVGEEVRLKGWLYNRRGKGKLLFLVVRDGTGDVQCVAFKAEVPEETFLLCKEVARESSVVVTGNVRADERSAMGVEIGLTGLEVVSGTDGEYPIQIQDTTPDVGFLMKNRHLWIRSRRQAATLRIRAEVVRAIREFFDERDFFCVDAPVLTPAACEGTSTLFEVDYFDDKAYLTQSGQLYGEAACMALGKIYCFGPTFRAEKSKTRKHLTEFWMVEPEVAWLELDGLMELAEAFVSHVVGRVLERRREDLGILERDVSLLEKVLPPFPRLSYAEAVEKVKAAGVGMEFGEDFGAPQEEAVAQGYDRPVMVHRYPSGVKAFYMQPDPENPDLAMCVDMIAPEGYGEIIGGSQRIHDPELLSRRIEEHDLPREAFHWYLDLRRFGSVPHAGFGLGIERTVAWITGAEHVRECAPFPRMLHKIYP